MKKIVEITICSNKTRTISQDYISHFFIYIPLNEKEKQRLFPLNMMYPCWRIKVVK